MRFFTPIEFMLLPFVKEHPSLLPFIYAGAAILALLLLSLLWVFRKYSAFVFKSLFRNIIRTALTGMAVVVFVFVVTLVWSVLCFLDLVMSERSKDLKAVITERYQLPSQMPFSYAAGLEAGAARPDDPNSIRPDDSMTWQFFGGTMDPTKRTRENLVFFFAMDPRKIRSMMDDLDKLDPELIEKMLRTKNGVLMGKDRLAAIHKRVGERFTLTSINYKDMVLDFEVVGQLPPGRYDQSAIMNRDYLNDALEAWPRTHNGQKHPMAQKTLNLVWLRVPDSEAFSRVADQIASSSEFTSPPVKTETASSGISSFLDSYKDMIWAVKWLLVPSLLVTMALVIATAISISVRERRTEMAVLKVLGFSPTRIMVLVLGEAILVGMASGLLGSAVIYGIIMGVFGGIPFPIAFFPRFEIPIDALWWGPFFGGLTAVAGSLTPALSARKVKVSEVFSKVG